MHLLPREALVARVVHREVDLRREHVRVARPAGEHLAEELLRRAARVDVRGVDEVDAGVERRVDAGARLLVGDAAAVGEPRAEAISETCEVAVAELPVSHRGSIVPEVGTVAVGTWRTVIADGESRSRPARRAPSAARLRPLARPLPRLRRVRDDASRRPCRSRGGEPAAHPAAAAASSTSSAEEADRIPTGVDELDRVLGGGLVPASLVLVGGEPGVGKSTLLLAALGAIVADRRALLVTGEESVAQVKLRAARLGGCDAASRSSPRPSSTPSARRSSASGPPSA